MPGVIKGGYGGYVYVNNFDTDEPVMKTVYGKRPKRMAEIINTTDRNAKATAAVEKFLADEKRREEEEEAAGNSESELSSGNSVSAEEARIEREKLIEEYEAIRQKYERESEEFVVRAREKATEIYDQTKELATKTVLDARNEAEAIKKQASEDAARMGDGARKQGYDDGYKQGYDEGYVKALKKCKESLLELKALAEKVTEDKTEIMMQYERQLFDTIFEIAERVTLGALGQKEKGIITRMIREAGRKFKASKNVKITLSKLDVSEEAEIDEDLLKDVFRNCENVEIELLEDAPAGTLMIDDGSEITDASIMTQLKMVEQLGKGKYRDKSLGDLLQENKSSSKAKGGRKRSAAAQEEEAPEEQPAPAAPEQISLDDPADDDTAVPDVVYTKGTVPAADVPPDDDDIEAQIENA